MGINVCREQPGDTQSPVYGYPGLYPELDVGSFVKECWEDQSFSAETVLWQLAPSIWTSTQDMLYMQADLCWSACVYRELKGCPVTEKLGFTQCLLNIDLTMNTQQLERFNSVRATDTSELPFLGFYLMKYKYRNIISHENLSCQVTSILNVKCISYLEGLVYKNENNL